MIHTLSHIPERDSIPRKKGLTMVMDKGLSLREAEDFIETAGHLADFIKLGFGTSVVTKRVKEKVKKYQNAGLIVYAGGTLFEAYAIRNNVDGYKAFIDSLGLDGVEISDGSARMDHKKKCAFIHRFSSEYTVLSEVGSKSADVEIPEAQWIEMMKKELESGSLKVIAEARESGTVGIYNSNGSADTSLIDALANHIDPNAIIWEAPLKAQQAWFIRYLGAHVNLGNIAPHELIAMETLRLGLRGDTFFRFLPEGWETNCIE
ncbi:MAG: phosphosulfolactate synthase [Bacteroidia bacterium]|jgi:phosphosulfolactate synthase|nr:phosphosulfolactate synthase [Bacteroidales bacterium]NCD40471.1 phosphosulfolactate synthase [Bacteroidia bacterium]MDD2322085.1 phosphosulfolactate synthase [Bacteroidales bacterium]MDD3011496.1 phosphosulfolactate synthase [Bacteroidales bacterium]MDD3961615.1 phosphosulfolactate synthase [Bacteroidales bacterium]